MLTYQVFRCPSSGFTNSVSTSTGYIGLFETGQPVARLWQLGREGTTVVAEVAILWPANKHLPVVPAQLENLPEAILRHTGYYGQNTVTLPDGREFRLPLTTGGYLTSTTGELISRKI